MKKNDYVKIVDTNKNYRYGYIASIEDGGSIIKIDLFDEGESKIAYDAEVGDVATDWISILTEIEKKIIPLLAERYTTNEIACQLYIKPSTVRAHLRTLRIKLHLENRPQLVAFCQGLRKMIEKRNV